MRAVVQRVSQGWVRIATLLGERSEPGARLRARHRMCRGTLLGRPSDGERTIAKIGRGLVVLLGVGDEDGADDASYMADKILGLRIFPDDRGKCNHSVLDVQGEVLVVSQFTLYGDCRRGRRPSFTAAALPERAVGLYEAVAARLAESGLKVLTGEFRAMMSVGIVNDGPVTILIDSKKVF